MNLVMQLVQMVGMGVTFVLLLEFTPLPKWGAFVLAGPLFLISFWIVGLVVGRRIPSWTEYKGYEIRCVPHRLVDSSDWIIEVIIMRNTGKEVRQRQFGGSDRYKTKGEAIQHGFNFGAHIIDGNVKDCSVADL